MTKSVSRHPQRYSYIYSVSTWLKIWGIHFWTTKLRSCLVLAGPNLDPHLALGQVQIAQASFMGKQKKDQRGGPPLQTLLKNNSHYEAPFGEKKSILHSPGPPKSIKNFCSPGSKERSIRNGIFPSFLCFPPHLRPLREKKKSQEPNLN